MISAECYAFGEFVLQRSQQRLLRGDGSPVELTPRVYATLLLLVENAGELIEKDRLVEQVWPGLVVGDNSLSQVIARLRRLLRDEAQESRFIQTVPRKGFRFIAPVTPLDPPRPTAPAAPDEAAPPFLGANLAAADAPRVEAASPALHSAAAGSTAGRWTSQRRRMLVGMVAAAAVTVGSAVWWARQRGAGEGLGGRATMAVLPFTPVGNEGVVEQIDVGMADSLIARLSVLPSLVVLAPTSVARFAAKDRDPVRAARVLDADWVVDGSVQHNADRVRVVARLIRASDGSITWSQSFDRELSALFDLQDSIADQLLKALAGVLPQGADGGPAESGGTRNLEAYQLYLTACWRAQGGRASDIERAVSLLGKALAIDPNYARAWATLGWVHRRRLWHADTPPAEVFAKADAAVQRATALAPNLSLALAGVGFSRFWFGFDWSGGEQSFRAALKSNPSESNARWGLAFLLLTQGRTEEGFIQLRLARELDPMSPVMHTLEATFLAGARRFEQARQRLTTALDIAPNHWLAHASLGRLLVAEGKVDAGVASLRRAVELAPDSVRPRAHLAVQLATMGQTGEARSLLEQMHRRASYAFVPPTSLAMVHAALGEKDAALGELARAYDVRDTRLVELKGDPSWDSLRNEPRFEALAHRLGLDGPGQALSSV